MVIANNVNDINTPSLRPIIIKITDRTVKNKVAITENNLFAFTSPLVNSLFGCLIGANKSIVAKAIILHIMTHTI